MLHSLSPNRVRTLHRRLVRGVSLVEALVSLAVMSFGMLGVVGVQATLRYNAEVSKQRSEAVRIGQEEMESLRSFVQQAVCLLYTSDAADDM
jgi:Tfp pilus assembly protein PilV